jgi:hypothetical protein
MMISTPRSSLCLLAPGAVAMTDPAQAPSVCAPDITTRATSLRRRGCRVTAVRAAMTPWFAAAPGLPARRGAIAPHRSNRRAQ